MDVTIDGRTVSLTDEQLSMFDGLTKLQKGVALVKLNQPLMTDYETYVKGGGRAKTKESIEACASELLSNPKMARFLTSFNAERLAPAVMSRDEMLERLTTMARTNINDIVNIINSDEEYMNCESGDVVAGQTAWSLKPLNEMTNGGIDAISELTAGKEGYKFKLHDQRAAMKQLAELMGYDAAVKQEVTVVKSLEDFYGDA